MHARTVGIWAFFPPSRVDVGFCSGNTYSFLKLAQIGMTGGKWGDVDNSLVGDNECYSTRDVLLVLLPYRPLLTLPEPPLDISLDQPYIIGLGLRHFCWKSINIGDSSLRSGAALITARG